MATRARPLILGWLNLTAATQESASSNHEASIRVLGHDLDGVPTIGFENPYCPRRAMPWVCRNTMISRTAFYSTQAARMLAARTGPMPSTSRSQSGVFSPKAHTSFLA